jgi:hypothetical protein
MTVDRVERLPKRRAAREALPRTGALTASPFIVTAADPARSPSTSRKVSAVLTTCMAESPSEPLTRLETISRTQERRRDADTKGAPSD